MRLGRGGGEMGDWAIFLCRFPGIMRYGVSDFF